MSEATDQFIASHAEKGFVCSPLNYQLLTASIRDCFHTHLECSQSSSPGMITCKIPNTKKMELKEKVLIER